MRFRQHRWPAGLLMVLILLGCGSKESDPPKVITNPLTAVPDERKFEVMEVKPIPICYTISAVGSLKSLEDVTISPKKSGIINEILVKEGGPTDRADPIPKRENIFLKRVKHFSFFERLAFGEFFCDCLTPRRSELFYDFLSHPWSRYIFCYDVSCFS